MNVRYHRTRQGKKAGKRVIVPLLACTWLISSAGAADAVRVMRTPDSGLQPQSVEDDQGVVHLVYLKGDPKACDVCYARREPGDTKFTRQMQVSSEPGSSVALGTVRGAQLAMGPKGRVHVVWNGSQHASGNGVRGAPMLYARVDDSGNRFEPQRNLMTSTMDLDGGGSVAADGRGNVWVVWHARERGGADGEEHRGVFVAHSSDEGKTFIPERQVNASGSGACGCCGLKAFADAEGRLAVLYRSADGTGNRDSVLLLSEKGAASFQSRILGRWHISTCPMSTPALGEGPGHTLLAMWETQGQVYRRAFEPGPLSSGSATLPAEGDKSDRKHPAFALSRPDGARLLVAWVEGSGWAKGGQLGWECVESSTGAKTRGRGTEVPAWSLPAVVPEADGGFTILY
ncbi:MAG TPA: hypothetical protein VNZ64_15680 [Candidatus Acidoferrum sp.]|jgi:hypothetical protein|nr:hypothetical protein [Candidatus Acidoferrum sp.]